VPPGAVNRYFHSAALWNDKLVVFGGVLTTFWRMTDVLFLDLNTLDWSLAAPPDAPGGDAARMRNPCTDVIIHSPHTPATPAIAAGRSPSGQQLVSHPSGGPKWRSALTLTLICGA
jgi:hypothetical protein